MVSPLPATPHGADRLDWGLLRSFLAVVRAGSLSAAATTLGVTQPTVGRQIRALEEEVGEALFDRIPQGLRPTERAIGLFEHAASLEQAAIALTAAMAVRPEAPSGSVRVTATEPLGVEILPRILAPFLCDNPGISVEIVLSSRIENLLRRDADIAIRFSRPDQEELIGRQIGQIELGFFAAEAYLLRHGTPLAPDELLTHRLIGPDRDAYGLKIATQIGVAVNAENFVMRTDSMLAQEAAARAGIGIAVMQVSRAMRLPGLVRLLAPHFAPRLPVWLVAHADVRHGRRYRSVFDHLAAELPREFAAPLSPAATAALAPPGGSPDRRGGQ